MSAKVKKPRILVANRSEIACRIFQACREMGMTAVGIATEADLQARHVTFAEELHVVPSYLDVATIVSLAKKIKIDFIHPGYGFLSERPEFAEACEKAGIGFIGPFAETIREMGSKIRSKQIAENLKIPTAPWVLMKSTAARAALEKEAARVGFPLLCKASAGGGGKGMRVVRKMGELPAAIESACAEAQAAFGDGTIFLERLLENARHIEVQVFGDATGKGIHLFERECSLQRRHQKVMEEAQAPNLKSLTRKALYDSALKLVRETKYRGAGTCEFLVDQKQNIYFLEMNTRLQVEHPVTELITGIDLVALQLEQALAGKTFKLPVLESARGHAVEARLYAEDPSRGFIPTPGRIEALHFPSGPGIRVDSGIEVGQEITTHFDPMLAKLIVWAPSREKAWARMRFALEETVIQGVGTNQAYLLALASDAAVLKGSVHTGYLEKEFKNTYLNEAEDPEKLKWLALGGPRAVVGQTSGEKSFPSPWETP